MAMMVAVPWLTPVTSPTGDVGLRVAQNAPEATVLPGQLVQTPALEVSGQAEIVQDNALRPMGHTVVTVATVGVLELQLVVIFWLAIPSRLVMPLVTSCVMGTFEKVPMSTTWLVRPGDATEGEMG
jgi:hypothetical protein